MQNQLDSLLSTIFKTPFFWAKDNFFRIGILLVLIYVFVLPLIQSFQTFVKRIDYFSVGNSIWLYILETFNVFVYGLILILSVLVIGLLYVILELKKSKSIQDNFDHGLNLWNIPYNAGWGIQKCSDANGNMLVVSQSNSVGILKPSHSWYDYEFSFYTKFKSSNRIKLAIRAENGSNAVIFDLTKNSLTPYILYNGKLILDERHKSPFSILLTGDSWMKVRLTVVGNEVEFQAGYGNKVYYKIPTLSITVEKGVLDDFVSTPTLEQLHESNKKWRSAIDKFLSITAEGQDPPQEEYDKAYQAIPQNTELVTFDYSKGTVGFMAHEKEKLFIRKVVVKKI